MDHLQFNTPPAQPPPAPAPDPAPAPAPGNGNEKEKENGNGQPSITLDLINFFSGHPSNSPLQLEIPHLSINIDAPPTIPPAAAAAPAPANSSSKSKSTAAQLIKPLSSSPGAIDLRPSNNSVQFPSARSFSSASSQSSSDSSSAASPSTTSLLHSFTAPIPTLRHSSASLFELLDSQHHVRPTTQRTHHRTLASPQLHAYLTNSSLSHQSSSQPLSPKSPNSIKFPSTSPTATVFTFVSSPAQNGPNQHDSFDWLTKHWLTSTFAPDPANSEAHRSPIPELDILVGFKSITDQLNLPPLDRDQAWSALQHVFPTAQSWARPTPAGLRSNKEFVVTGIKLKREQGGQKPPAPAKDPTRPLDVLTPETTRSAQTMTQPFRQLDCNQPIPEEVHSSELVEHMRKRICALELQSQLQGAKISSNRRKLLKHTHSSQSPV